jgi:predicted MPP superfamily phosphohydrolase
MKRMRISRRGFIGLAATGVAGVGVLEWGEVDRLTVERRELRLPRWKADGFKVALLSDLHCNDAHEGDRAAEALRLAIEEKPDAVLVAGDFINSETDQTFPSLETALEPVREAGMPVLAVLGNHDYWVTTTSRLIAVLMQKGMRLLRNEIAEVEGVAVWGIDDGIAKRDKHDVLTDRTDSGSVLALFHEPDYVDRVDNRIGLMMAGHSHGGQICLPPGIPVHTPVGARRYRRGFYAKAEVPLYVTRGVGTVGPRRRAFCPPEVSVLTLFGGAQV